MTRPTTNQVIKTIKAAGIPAVSLASQVQLKEMHGVLHSSRIWCRRSPMTQRHEVEADPYTVEDLDKWDTCDCVAEDLIGRYRWNLSWPELLIGVTWDAKNVTPEMTRLAERFESGKGRKPAIGLVGKLSKRAAEALRAIEDLRGKKPGNQVLVYLDEVEDEVVKAFNRMRRAGQRGGHKQLLLEKIQKELVPSKWTGALPTVDETPLIVGIAPLGRGANQQLREVLATFTISQTKEGQLLEMPRYAYEYILRAFTPGSYHWMQVQAAEHPGSDIVETLAGVWNPADPGALRDLNKAIEAARILKG